MAGDKITSDSYPALKAEKRPLIIGASIGNCVHVAGVVNFFLLAEAMGFETNFLGAAVPPEKVIEAVNRLNPDVLGISYRLTPEVGEVVLKEFLNALGNRPNLVLLFGGTSQMVEATRRTGRFHFYFVGDESIAEVKNVLLTIRGHGKKDEKGVIYFSSLWEISSKENRGYFKGFKRVR